MILKRGAGHFFSEKTTAYKCIERIEYYHFNQSVLYLFLVRTINECQDHCMKDFGEKGYQHGLQQIPPIIY